MTNKLLYGIQVLDGLKQIDTGSVQCIVTSPPYWGLRNYGVEGQLGIEQTPDQYVNNMVEVFREAKRVLKSDGTLWLNLGDSYAGSNGNGYKQTVANENASNAGGVNEDFRKKFKKNDSGYKPKDLIGIPWRTAFALQSDGWYLRQGIIWHKPNPMPESVQDRCTTAHEFIFLLTKSAKYFCDMEAINEPAAYDGRKDTVMKGSKKYEAAVVPGQQPHTMASGRHERWNEDEDGNKIRNRRSVWTIATVPYPEAHFATFPPELPKLCILAGSKKGDTILDPFAGSGTTLAVAAELERIYIGIDLDPKNLPLAQKRLREANLTIGLDL